MWQDYYTPNTLEEAVTLLDQFAPAARIIAGGTDLILEIERDQRPDTRILIDISRIPGLDQIEMDEKGIIHLGPLVTHNHCAASKILVKHGFALARACWEVGAPQIRNRATVAGNLITASPANDSIPALTVLDANVTLRSVEGERVVPLAEFYQGVRRTVMQPNELLVEISFPALKGQTQSNFIKLGLRRAQAISVVNAAVMVRLDGKKVEEARIALGSVAPVIVRAAEAEAALVGQTLKAETLSAISDLALKAAKPIDDLRGSAAYRMEMVRVCVLRALREIAEGQQTGALPDKPVMLWGKHGVQVKDAQPDSYHHNVETPIETTINGERYTFNSGHDKTLLRLIREEGHLTGTKEGCAEGECGACTVFLDGVAVMACLIPAPRAHQAEIITIEGIAHEGQLHPFQQAFVEAGAVQCGYCTPGFIMSGVKLLEENPDPGESDIQQSISGNLCRCTGYYKIIEAFESAAKLME
jgi:xanthine dehydrogenase iron-sulfur cluster and FAD-binding subunit A